MAEVAASEAGAVDAPDQRDVDLLKLVRESPFPLFALRLSDARVLEVSRPLETWGKRPRSELLGASMLDVINDPENGRRSLDLLASGAVDAYTRSPEYRHRDGSLVAFQIRITAATDELPRRTALAMILSDGSAASTVRLVEPTVTEELMVLGTVNSEWKIDRITSDAPQLLGYGAAELLGHSAFEVVHPEDVPCLLILVSHADDQGGSSGRLRLRHADGDYVETRVSVQPLAGEPRAAFAFVLTPITNRPVPTEVPRVRELEDHLRRIAREVAASGVAAWSSAMPTAAEVPEISQLTAREYAIVVRLASGDRVPAIARALFLSESTVRNHLTSVFRKFGVHSQVDLMSRLHSVG